MSHVRERGSNVTQVFFMPVVMDGTLGDVWGGRGEWIVFVVRRRSQIASESLFLFIDVVREAKFGHAQRHAGPDGSVDT